MSWWTSPRCGCSTPARCASGRAHAVLCAGMDMRAWGRTSREARLRRSLAAALSVRNAACAPHNLQVEARCCDAAAELGLRRLAPEERGPEDVPFDVNPVALPQAASQQPGAPLEPPADAAPGGAGGGSRGGVESLAEVEAAVEAQGRAVRALKESGMTNQDSAVQAGVQVGAGAARVVGARVRAWARGVWKGGPCPAATESLHTHELSASRIGGPGGSLPRHAGKSCQRLWPLTPTAAGAAEAQEAPG